MFSFNIKNYIFFGLYLILNPWLLMLLFKRVYIPVYIQYEWLRNIDLMTFIDAGAYRGRVLKVISYLFPKAQIYAFEPLAENYKAIIALNLPPSVRVEKLALSNKVDSSDFHKSSYLPASSLLPLKKKLGKYQFISKTRKVKVNTNTLDNYFKGLNLERHIVLKLDTQGSEYIILSSGKRLLKQTSIVILETTFKGLYKGERKFNEIYRLLVNMGFEYYGNISDSEFYPRFSLSNYSNSIFIKRKQIKLLLTE
ncbi:MAG: FkbM family methyltransferase [Candidatus Woesebacteria bacterium GW2011_GWA1_39_21b]|uniref:FkbM family methyltransferase n=1 Tax=Candidatus Woesebacteria bacterium GW2011_GWA1_39_21b TaxID=1618551 RepID=A0A0G0NCZ5_9BACT|nr:MAG: FkbM family methyltransferase [Microgenomates group bacterium GW2011_GWC1_38_12]KKR14039.1 MAG: FkbM family methyltransferase [Candidatus Woesebacteria bacterium GW2011_GWA1_39_21b]